MGAPTDSIVLAYLNIHGQSGLTLTKQKQIEDFLRRYKIDVLNWQEINTDDESFNQCTFLMYNYYILSNNAVNKYGTTTFIKNGFIAENIKMDTCGRAIFFDIENSTLGNVYLQSGTDGNSRGSREQYCAETIPELLVNCKESGCWGGDLNCITESKDCTSNPGAKKSPSMSRLTRAFSHIDSFRSIHPDVQEFSRFYTHTDGTVQASRIDRSYHWGNCSIQEAEYRSVAFSDHFSFIVKVSLPGLDIITSPQSRHLFKTSPEVICDKVFKERLAREMVEWKKVKERGLSILPWWEIVVKLAYAALLSIEVKN